MRIPRVLAVLATLALSSGCDTVAFYEKEHLSDPLMDLEESGTAVHWEQKVFFSREGSIGGIGSSAGGGCGCY